MKTTSEYSLLRTALGNDWAALDADTQRRFSERAEQVKHYTGMMSRVHCSGLGRIMALGARLLRAPLIPQRGTNIPIHVTVTPNPATGIVTKYRAYHFPNRAPLTVTSLMRHDEALGYTECVGSALASAVARVLPTGRLMLSKHGVFSNDWSRTDAIAALANARHHTRGASFTQHL